MDGRTGGITRKLRRKHTFSNRVVKFWNGLPQEVVECDSIATFKKGLDRYMDGLGIT